MSLTKSAEQLLNDLATTLDVSDERYEAAERSYKSLGNWLQRPDSKLSKYKLNLYIQGSFRLGTPIRPLSDEEDYDLDIVCEIGLDKLLITQSDLHALLGVEIKSYANRYQMSAPERWRRCWTLNYADGAQFHMDVLPCIPDGARQRVLLEARNLSTTFANQAVAITDDLHPNFRRISDEWPISNPNGYASWFYERMRSILEMRKAAIMLAEKKASIADIPDFRAKTPLQAAVQILKRHRDVRFSDSPDDRPSSISLTTLSALSYGQEGSVAGALLSILARMDSFIENRNGEWWVPNPSDPRENFVDVWKENPKKRDFFYEWLEDARADFKQAAASNNADEFVNALAPRVGRQIVEKAAHKKASGGLLGIVKSAASAIQKIVDAPHRKPVTWPIVKQGSVAITSATYTRDGYRPQQFVSGVSTVPAGSSIRLEAKTDVPKPYRVYWQIVNTGRAATDAKNLRGGFEEISVETGTLTKTEGAKYPGTHSAECFIVKNEYCVARSGLFVVNIT